MNKAEKNFKLTRAQMEFFIACIAIFEGAKQDNKLLVLIGMGIAGSGKTEVIRRVLNYCQETNKKVFACATTNAAAKNLKKKSGFKVTTVHELFSFGLRTTYKNGRPASEITVGLLPEQLRDSVVFIDEAFMLSSELVQHIFLRAHALNIRLIFVGDPYQLAPIGADTSPELMNIKNKVMLREVIRQAKDNAILKQAAKYRDVLDGGQFQQLTEDYQESYVNGKGETVPATGVRLVSREEFYSLYVDAISDSEYSQNPHHVRALAYTNRAVCYMNDFARCFLYGDADAPIAEGERLIANSPLIVNGKMEIRNNQEFQVFSVGETGKNEFGIEVISAVLIDDHGKNIRVNVCRDHQTARSVITKLKNAIGRTKTNEAREAAIFAYEQAISSYADLRPLHAMTIHKAQGQTIDRVFLDVESIKACPTMEDSARLLYVALTRARFEVIATGEVDQQFIGHYLGSGIVSPISQALEASA